MKRSANRQRIFNLVLAAMFMAIGIVLPFFTGQIPQIGSMLLPMHLPVLLCGLICGWQYGGVVGFLLPLVRSLWLGMPPILTAAAMAFELAAYGVIVGVLYNRSKWKCVLSLYRALVVAMIGGRIVWGLATVVITGVAGEAFTWGMFVSGALLNAIPGIVLQLVFVPAVMVTLNRTGLVRFTRNKKKNIPVSTGQEN